MKCLFYIAKIYSIPIIKPLVNYCNQTNIEYGFYISEKIERNFPEEWDKEKKIGSISEAKKFHPDFILCPGNFTDFRIPGIKVQIFHGLGVEKKSHYKIRHFFDVYLTSGPVVTKKFQQLQKRYGYFLVRETGWPKIDYILNYDTTNLKKKFLIPENKKVILYAPTFSRTMESASDLLPVIPEIAKEDEIWLLKFHELMNKDIIESIKKTKKTNLKVIDIVDITPLLHLADLMISDTSSVIYEFMVLNKPVITYKTHSRKNKGINIHYPYQLKEAINRAYANSLKICAKEQLAEVNPYLSGNISKRIFDTLDDIKQNNLLPDKKKPANLFRKYQILFHSLFRKGYLR